MRPDDADNASSKFDKVGSVVKGMGVAIGAAVVAAGAALAGLTKSFLDLAESTREYREDQAKLDAAFITAGFTTDQAGEAYKSFYSILGEEDRSVEAVNHLAQLVQYRGGADKMDGYCRWRMGHLWGQPSH